MLVFEDGSNHVFPNMSAPLFLAALWLIDKIFESVVIAEFELLYRTILFVQVSMTRKFYSKSKLVKSQTNRKTD